MHTIRLILVPFIFIVAVSCSDNSKNKTDQPKLQLKDTTLAQNETRRNPYSPIDVSPMDMSYYPVDYTKLKMTGSIKEPPVARVIYSRPHLQGRQLFHGLLNYDEPWRLGANESTEIQLFKNISIQDKNVNEGRYILYCIPHQNNWTIIFNKNIDTWGLKPDSAQDAYHFDVPVKQTDNHIEYFTIAFEKAGAGANLLMAWDDVEARLHFTFQ
jgi:Protein of unknown function (DUF2911)